MISTAVILAAGRGSRLQPITRTRSKGLAPVVGMPLIARIVAVLRAVGITRFHVVIAPHDDELRQYFATDTEVNIHVQEQPLGSGDALRCCRGYVTGAFLVCACDSLIAASDIQPLLNAASAGMMVAAIMEVSPEVSLQARSVVALQGDRIADIIEKPLASERVSNITSLPLYVLHDEIFKELDTVPRSKRGEYELPEAIRSFIHKGGVVTSSRVAAREDITTLDDLLALNLKLLAKLEPSIQISEPASIPPSVSIVPPVCIDAGVSIGDGATLGPSVYLESGSVVDAGVRLARVVVTRGGRATHDAHDEIVVPAK